MKRVHECIFNIMWWYSYTLAPGSSSPSTRGLISHYRHTQLRPWYFQRPKGWRKHGRKRTAHVQNITLYSRRGVKSVATDNRFFFFFMKRTFVSNNNNLFPPVISLLLRLKNCCSIRA